MSNRKSFKDPQTQETVEDRDYGQQSFRNKVVTAIRNSYPAARMNKLKHLVQYPDMRLQLRALVNS